MTQPIAVQLLGFAGSGLIVTGVMMRPVAWLRAFALAGSVAFIVYGVLLGAWPIVLTNVTTTSLHAYHLRAHAQTRRRFAAAERCAAEGNGVVHSPGLMPRSSRRPDWAVLSSNSFVTKMRKANASTPRLSVARSASASGPAVRRRVSSDTR